MLAGVALRRWPSVGPCVAVPGARALTPIPPAESASGRIRLYTATPQVSGTAVCKACSGESRSRRSARVEIP